jgi:hypothetical protein
MRFGDEVRYVYRRVLEIQTLQDPTLHDVSSGLLISRLLDHRYDRLEWSLYCKVRLRADPSIDTFRH